MNSDYRNILNLTVWISISGSVPWDLLCKWLYVCTFYLTLIQKELKVAVGSNSILKTNDIVKWYCQNVLAKQVCLKLWCWQLGTKEWCYSIWHHISHVTVITHLPSGQSDTRNSLKSHIVWLVISEINTFFLWEE